MNDLLGNHIGLRHWIPRPVVGQLPGTVFMGMHVVLCDQRQLLGREICTYLVGGFSRRGFLGVRILLYG